VQLSWSAISYRHAEHHTACCLASEHVNWQHNVHRQPYDTFVDTHHQHQQHACSNSSSVAKSSAIRPESAVASAYVHAASDTQVVRTALLQPNHCSKAAQLCVDCVCRIASVHMCPGAMQQHHAMQSSLRARQQQCIRLHLVSSLPTVISPLAYNNDWLHNA
jgi:hypothetical protein